MISKKPLRWGLSVFLNFPSPLSYLQYQRSAFLSGSEWSDLSFRIAKSLPKTRGGPTTHQSWGMRLWWRKAMWRCWKLEVFEPYFLGQIGEDGETSGFCQMIRIYFNIFHGVDIWNRFLGHLATGTDPNRWLGEFVCKYRNKFRISRLSLGIRHFSIFF